MVLEYCEGEGMIEIDKIIKEINNNKLKILEAFATAYLSETGLMPSQVVMCEQTKDNVHKIWFEKKRYDNDMKEKARQDIYAMINEEKE